ncbi:MAG: ABC transporter permease [Rhodothalassiaceae bacterium]|nr:MAG: ABC transporter permease [Rhodothalassiaceae bacterium]
MQWLLSLVKIRWRRRAEWNAIGMMALVLAVLFIGEAYVYHENHYDRWVPDYRRVVRVEIPYGNEPDGHLPLSQPGLHRRLSGLDDVVERIARLSQVKAWTFAREEGASIKSEFVLPVRFADPSFAEIFGLRSIAGEDAAVALTEPDALVLTVTQARRIAPDVPPAALVGMTLSLKNGARRFRIRSIIADPPSNSHLRLAALASLAHPPPDIPTEGLASLLTLDVYTYLRLRPGLPVRAAEEKLREVFSQPAPDGAPFIVMGASDGYRLMPVSRIYSHARGMGEMKPPRDPGLWHSVLLLHALTWLLFALNVMVFAQARMFDGVGNLALHRLFGMGGHHGYIFGFTQAVIPMVLAAGAGIILAVIILGISQARELLSAWWQSGAVAAAIMRVFLSLAVVAAASCIPLAALMRIRPGPLLLEQGGGPKGTQLQSALIAVELGIVALVLLGSIIAWRQVAFLSALPRGMDMTDRFVAKIYSDAEPQRLHSFLENMSRQLGAISYAATDIVLPMHFDLSKRIQLADSDAGVQADVFHVHGNLPRALGIPILAGQWFQGQGLGGKEAQNFQGPGGAVVSAALARLLGFADPAAIIGHQLRIPDFTGTEELEQERLPVVGVVGDVRWAAPEMPARPVVYVWSRQARPFSVFLHLPGGRAADLERALKAAHERQFGPALMTPVSVAPLEAVLNDPDPHLLARQRLYGVFAIAVVFASMLGLLGYMRMNLTKMRRAMALHRLFGAEAAAIHGLAIRRLIGLALIGTALGVAVGWQRSAAWLAGFVDRVQLTIGDVLLATSVPMALAIGISVIQVEAAIRQRIALLLRPTP